MQKAKPSFEMPLLLLRGSWDMGKPQPIEVGAESPRDAPAPGQCGCTPRASLGLKLGCQQPSLETHSTEVTV